MIKAPFTLFKSTTDLSNPDIHKLYDGFDTPIANLDCGKKCAPHNPNGKPFCCDICHVVPTAYKSEWRYFEKNTKLWHKWRGDECGDSSENEYGQIKTDTPKDMILLACLGPSQCQRDFRALSCRQFPFFPYVTSDYRFVGLSYEWEFENYAYHSERMRKAFVSQKRRIPLLHRNGKSYLISPAGERMRLAASQDFPRHGPYR